MKKIKKTSTVPYVKERKSMNSRNNTLDSELFTILLNVQEKLNSPVFNGGFETLAASVEDIKTSQHKTEEHITAINKTIYEPDEGLFSRIKAVEKVQETQMMSIQHRVTELEDFRGTVYRLLWLVIPASIGLVVKTLWDVITTHIAIK